MRTTLALFTLSLLLTPIGCSKTSTAPMAAISPVMDRALVRAGQTAKPITATEAAKFSKPYDTTPQAHYLVSIDGKEAALSLYYLGDDEAKSAQLHQTLSTACGSERSAGQSVTCHMQGIGKRVLFAHVSAGTTPVTERVMQDFMEQLFAHDTTGMELLKALH